MAYPLQLATKRELESKAQDIKFFVELDWMRNRWEYNIDSYDAWVQFREVIYLFNSSVSSATTDTLTLNDSMSGSNMYIGKYLLIREGGAEGQLRKIESHTTEVITLENSFDIVPYAGVSASVINILGVNDIDSNSRIGASAFNSFGVTALQDNIGSGTVANVAYTLSAQSDIWTLICITSEEIDGVQTARFLVKGETNGLQEDAFSDISYNNGLISFTVESGSRDFEEGDTFILRPALTTKKDDAGDFQEATVFSGTDYTSAPLLYGGPDFLAWDEITWEGSNVEVYVRTSNSDTEPTWSRWSLAIKDQIISGEQLGMYLQIRVKLIPPTPTTQPIIYGLKIKYKVKAHTNFTSHYQHVYGFNRIKSIRVSRSKSEALEGYSAADMNITWDNSDGSFSKENVDSPYFGYLRPNIGVKIYTGFSEELIPRLDGFIGGFNVQAGGRSFTTRGKDRIKLLIKKKIKKGDAGFRSWTNQTLAFLVKILALDSDFPLEDLDLFDLVVNPEISYVTFKGKHAWEAIQALATGALADVFATENGKLKVIDKFSPKYSIPAPGIYTDGADYLNIIHNDYFKQVVFSVMYKQANVLYSYLNSELQLITEGVFGMTYVYNDDFQSGRERHNIWFTSENTLYRLLGSLTEIGFEEIANIQTIDINIKFTNLSVYNKIYKDLIGGYVSKNTEVDTATANLITVKDNLGVVDTYKGDYVLIKSGVESGNMRQIKTHTSLVITLETSFDTVLVADVDIDIIELPKRTIADLIYYAGVFGIILSDRLSYYKYSVRDTENITEEFQAVDFEDHTDSQLDPYEYNTATGILYKNSKLNLEKESSGKFDTEVFKVSVSDGSLTKLQYDDTFNGNQFFFVPEGETVTEGNGEEGGYRVPWSGNGFKSGYAQSPSSWRFGDTNDEIIINYRGSFEALGDYYRIVYTAKIPIRKVLDTNLYEDYRVYKNLTYNGVPGYMLSLVSAQTGFSASDGDVVTGNNGEAVVFKHILPDGDIYDLHRLYIYDITGEFEEEDTITVNGKTAEVEHVYKVDKTNEVFFNRIITVYEESGSDYHGHLFYLDTADSYWGPASLVVKSTSFDFATSIPGAYPYAQVNMFTIPNSSMLDTSQTGEIHKVIAVEAMPNHSIVVVLCECFKEAQAYPYTTYSKTEYTYKLHWFKVDKPYGYTGKETEGSEIIYGVETLDLGDPRVRLYDAVYNPVYKHLDIAGGFTDDINQIAKLYRWSLTNIVVEFDNLAGKPFSNIYPDNAVDINTVIEKEYYYYFQKYGGYKSTTSEIYAWTDFMRTSEDKERCAVTQEIITLGTGDGVITEFSVPLANRPFDLQYVYIDGESIGTNFNFDGENAFLLEAPSSGSVVTAGAGKRVYRYYGTFLSYDLSSQIGGTPIWRDFTVSHDPYKPCKIRITINSDCNAGTVHIYGTNELGSPIDEIFDFGGAGIQTDENGDRYLESTNLFGTFNNAAPLSDADTCYNTTESRFRVESVYSDLIPGVILEIFTSVSDLDDQFGGDGTLSGYIDKVLIDVKKEGGLVEVKKISSEKRFKVSVVDKLNGVLYLGTENAGFTSRYSITGLDPIADYILEYDKNITDLSYGWDDNSIKNEIIVKSNKMETVPYRDVDIETGDPVSGNVPPSLWSGTLKEWLWARLERVWKSSAPNYLYKGHYLEYDVTFKDPVDNGGQINNIKFNAQFVENIGYLDENGYFKDSGDALNSDFPDHKLSDTLFGLHAGYGTSHTIDITEKYYRIFTPWDVSTTTLPAVYPIRYEDDFEISGDAVDVDLTDGIDLSGGDTVILNIGGSGAVTVSCASHAEDNTKVTATDIVVAINEAFLGFPASVFISRHTTTPHVLVQLKSTTRSDSTVISGGSAAVAIFGTASLTRTSRSYTRGELEKRNLIIYAGTVREPLTYEAGDFDIVEVLYPIAGDEVWALELTNPGDHVDKFLQLVYPDRINVVRSDIDKTYRDSDGSITNLLIQGSDRTLESYDPTGVLYTTSVGISGFHLNMIWPNDAVLHGVSFLRIENPTNDPVDSLYSSTEDPSQLGVWINKIELRGLPVVAQTIDMASVRDEKSIKEYGKSELSFQNEYIQDGETALKAGNYLLKRKAHPIIKPNLSIIGLPNLQLGDTVSIREINSGLAYDLCEILSLEDNLSGATYTMSITTFKVLDKPLGSLLIEDIYKRKLLKNKFKGAV